MFGRKRKAYESKIKNLEKQLNDLNEKHWNECVQIAEYDDENRELKRKLEIYHAVLIDILIAAPDTISAVVKKYNDEEKQYTAIKDLL